MLLPAGLVRLTVPAAVYRIERLRIRINYRIVTMRDLHPPSHFTRMSDNLS